MSDDYGQDLDPIPSEFHSEYEERPFQSCTRCGELLEAFPEGYKVSKVLNRGEVLFEYALCFPCLERMMEESSEESQRRLADFQEARLRPFVTGTLECALCDHTRDSMERKEFAIVAACLGQGLLESHLICIYCMEEMAELVSEKTRSEWQRFVEENFPGVPPGFKPVPSEPAPQVLV